MMPPQPVMYNQPVLRATNPFGPIPGTQVETGQGRHVRGVFEFKRVKVLCYCKPLKRPESVFLKPDAAENYGCNQFPSERRLKAAVKSFLIWPNAAFVSEAFNADLLGFSSTNKCLDQLLQSQE